MKVVVLLVVIVVACGLCDAGDDKPWPQKGDTVYVAASLVGFGTMTVPFGMGSMKMPDMPSLEPCQPMTLKSRSREGDKFTFEDDVSHRRRLTGEWGPWFFRTQAECKATIESTGPPRVKAKTGTYELVPAAPAH